MINKKKIIKGSSILNGIIFIFGGFTFFSDGKLLFGTIQLMAGFISLVTALTLNSSKFIGKTFRYGVYILNVIIPVTVSIDYFMAGKDMIQYAWILVALLSFIALIVYIKQEKGAMPDKGQMQ